MRGRRGKDGGKETTMATSRPIRQGDSLTRLAAARAMPTATTRRDDEISVGDVVEVVSCRSIEWTTVTDVGTRGRVVEIDESVGTVHLESYRGQRLPQEGIAGFADVRKLDRLYPPSPPQSPLQPPSPPSRFSLLEIDTDAASSLPQAPKASTGLAALQQELRAEREARRALAAAQTPPGRFDLLECD